MNDIVVGRLILDIGARPDRVGVVVSVDSTGFTIKHYDKYLTFPTEHPYHSFYFDESDEYRVINRVVKVP